MVDTTDEWIMSRTGIRERRIAEPGTLAMSELAVPAARRALAQKGVDAASIDLLVVATVTPDMAFPSTAALLADELGMPDAAAYDLSAGCTGFMYAIAQAYSMLASGLVAEGPRRSAATCSRRSSTGPTARRSCSSATAPERS